MVPRGGFGNAIGFAGADTASDLYLTFGFIPGDLAERFGSDVFRALEEAGRLKPDAEDLMGLAEIAEYEKDLVSLQNIQKKVNQLNTSLAEVILNKLDKLK